MIYLFPDNVNTFECKQCEKTKPWHKFPIKKVKSIYDEHQKGRSVNYEKRICFDCIKGRVKTKTHILMKDAAENNMQGLRDKLFETIDDLKRKNITIGEAKAICEVAQVIINSVKVEVEYLKAIGAKKGGSFIEIEN